MKEFFADELVAAMQQELVKQASAEQPSLVKAAECLHAALEIFEEQGLQARADQVLKLLEKLGQGSELLEKTAKIHSIKQLMEAGVTQRDLKEFARGNPVATAKLNLVLRKLGLSDHEIAKFLGPSKVMAEEAARKAINPNESGSILEFKSLAPKTEESPEESLEFTSLAFKKKHKNPGRPDKIRDPATKGLTPAKEVANLKNHGTPLNMTMADDANCAVDVPARGTMSALPGFEDLLSASDIEDSDDELMTMEITDNLEVFDKEIPLEDFEDERDIEQAHDKSLKKKILDTAEKLREIGKWQDDHIVGKFDEPLSPEAVEQAREIFRKQKL